MWRDQNLGRVKLKSQMQPERNSQPTIEYLSGLWINYPSQRIGPKFIYGQIGLTNYD